MDGLNDMRHHVRIASRGKYQLSEYLERHPQFQFDDETQKLHRELRVEIEKLKLENKINEQISKILERRLSELDG